MKYGLLMHKPTTNIGDDIQSYAISQFLPHVDYLINREKISDFVSKDHEPVAVVMAAWWMWHKWNWPPSRYILPYFTSFHYSDNKAAKQAGCPANYLFLSGIGGEYLNAYGPVGCRDIFTRDNLKAQGVDAEFSGCITITLPEQKRFKPEKEYICIVDVSKAVEKKIREQLKGTDIEIKKITHDLPSSHKNKSWEKRVEMVEDLLTVYQNAKCVVTRRLHCALPCLAMNVPVLLSIHTLESIRFIPYYDWLNCCHNKDFVSGKYEYDLTNPPKNPTVHLEAREQLINSVKGFVESAERMGDKTVDELYRLDRSDKEVQRWRNRNMKKTVKMWKKELHGDLTINEIKENKKLAMSARLSFFDVEKQNKHLENCLVVLLKQARRVFDEKKKRK